MVTYKYTNYTILTKGGAAKMSLIDRAFYRLLNGKKEITRPVFIKDFTKENLQLIELTKLSNKVISNKKEFIDRDITLLKYGLEGEQNLYYELKNSFIPMLCLHDIRLEYKDYVAQLDFIIITTKCVYVFETKKLSGDIEITSDGDFIRIIKNRYGKVIKKEGMYSPISQNERHVNILKEMLTSNGIIKTFPIKSAVIISNPKTIVNKGKAPKHIKNNLYKFDQVNRLLQNELNDKTNERNLLEKYMFEIANYILKNDRPISFDNIAKYSLTDDDFAKEMVAVQQELNNSDIYEELKKYRLEVSKQNNLKAYMVFTNEMLDALVELKPRTKEELLQIKGFGEKKVEMFGEKILEIIKETARCSS